jgi:hypothetical protein
LPQSGDVVEIVARADRGAGEQQQNLGQRKSDPARLAIVFDLGKFLQEKRQPGARHLGVEVEVHGGAPQ